MTLPALPDWKGLLPGTPGALASQLLAERASCTTLATLALRDAELLLALQQPGRRQALMDWLDIQDRTVNQGGTSEDLQRLDGFASVLLNTPELLADPAVQAWIARAGGAACRHVFAAARVAATDTERWQWMADTLAYASASQALFAFTHLRRLGWLHPGIPTPPGQTPLLHGDLDPLRVRALLAGGQDPRERDAQGRLCVEAWAQQVLPKRLDPAAVQAAVQAWQDAMHHVGVQPEAAHTLALEQALAQAAFLAANNTRDAAITWFNAHGTQRALGTQGLHPASVLWSKALEPNNLLGWTGTFLTRGTPDWLGHVDATGTQAYDRLWALLLLGRDRKQLHQHIGRIPGAFEWETVCARLGRLTQACQDPERANPKSLPARRAGDVGGLVLDALEALLAPAKARRPISTVWPAVLSARDPRRRSAGWS